MIELEARESVTILHMVRGKGNALNLEFVETLYDVLEKLEHSTTRAVVITGQGGTFGAGVDLNELSAGGAPYVRRYLPAMTRAFERLATLSKPVVAAVNGHAIAGGAIIMLACDIRLLARGGARVGLTEIQVGVLFPAWALEIARFATPGQHFSTLIATGRTWQGDDVLSRGLVDELVDADQLLERAVTVATEMGTLDPVAFAATKTAIRRPLRDAVSHASAGEEAVIEHWCSPHVLHQIGQFSAAHIKRRG